MPPLFKGTFVAIVTPFDERGAVDEPALIRLVERALENGVDGIVPCGTTGEKSTLSVPEHQRVIEVVVETVAGRGQVIAGTGSNDTTHAAMMAAFAKSVGADAALSVVPYYNKPTQEGLFRHYSYIADKAQIPLVPYNVPGRTSCRLLPATLMRLWQHPFIKGLKDASGNLEDALELLRAGLPDGFSLLSGEDSLTVPLIAIGGHGCISVAANEIPKEFSAMVRYALNGELKQALAIQNRVLPLLKANFIETNPIPVKTALALMGLIDGRLRLPLCELRPENEAQLKKILAELGLIG